jgi:tetratricopeptide (TPR) repeat protein
LLLVGAVVSTWQAVRATRAEAATRASLAQTVAVLDFVEKRVFAAARPEGQGGGLGREVTLRRAIDAALPFVDQSFHDQPLIEARLRMTLGRSYLYLGEAQVAADQYQKARTLYTQCLGPDHPDTLSSMNDLGDSYSRLGRYSEARLLHEEALALSKARLGPDHSGTLWSMSRLANSYYGLGWHAEALKLREQTLALCKAKLGPDHPDTLGSMNNLANGYTVLGRDAEAVKLHEETLALLKVKLGTDHPDTLVSMNGLAWVLATASDSKLRDPPRALELAKKAALQTKEPDRWGTLGTARYRSGDWQGAIADLEKAIGLRAPEVPINAAEGFFLAMAHWQRGDKDRARQWFARSVKWMDNGLTENAELKRFRAEAIELLGVQKKD